MPITNITTGQTIGNDMHYDANKLKELISIRLPDKVISTAEAIVHGSFDQEQFKDKNSSKWKPRKKEEKGGSLKLLVKSPGGLKADITIEKRGDEVVIGSDKIYAPVHNEGLRSGRGAGFQMPQRQFMPIPGQSNSELDEAMDKFMDDELDKIFG